MASTATVAKIAEPIVRLEERRGEAYISSNLRITTSCVSNAAFAPLTTVGRAIAAPATVALVTLLVGAFDLASPAGAYVILAAFSAALSALVFGKSTIATKLTGHPSRQALGISWRWAVVAGCLVGLAYLTHTQRLFSPMMLAAWLFVTPFALIAVDRAASYAIARGRNSGQPARSAVIVGATSIGMVLQQRIEELPAMRMKVEGFFDDRLEPRLPRRARAKHLGPLAQLPRYVNEHAVSDVYICLPIIWHDRIGKLLNGLEDTTASIYYVPDIYMHDLLHARVDVSLGIPSLVVVDTPFYGPRALVKRAADIAISLLALLCLSPVMLLCALGVKTSSPGPIFFRQKRYGMGGQKITVLKFRSMYVHNDHGNVVQAYPSDPRVTRFGGFLRKTSLDELPQLINVLRGDMSLVGPRPHAVQHNEIYRKVVSKYMVRHKVKPGITGLAQVRGFRGETETLDKMADRVKSDIEYIRDWSLSLDLRILLKTLKVLWFDRHAY